MGMEKVARSKVGVAVGSCRIPLTPSSLLPVTFYFLPFTFWKVFSCG